MMSATTREAVWAGNPPSRDEELSFIVAERFADARNRGAVRLDSRPEREHRHPRPVELVVADDVSLVAIEHTLIESYPDQINDGMRTMDWGNRVVAEIGDRLPPGGFDLGFDVHAVSGIKPNAARVRMVADWVLKVAPTLPKGGPGLRRPHRVTEGPPNLPLTVSLTRWAWEPDSPILPLQITRWLPDDLEERRAERVGKALATKCPKLASYRSAGTQTMLILEFDDIALAEVSVIEAAIREATHDDAPPLPDHLLVLESSYTPNGYIYILRESGRWVPWEEQVRLIVPLPTEPLRRLPNSRAR